MQLIDLENVLRGYKYVNICDSKGEKLLDTMLISDITWKTPMGLLQTKVARFFIDTVGDKENPFEIYLAR